MSSGIWGKWHICNWRRWDGPLLVLRLTGNLLQYSNTLLLVSQVVHLASHHWMALTISCARKQAVERALHLKQFGWCRPRCTGWTACLLARSIRRRLWAALGWCLRQRTAIGATCTGALCAWAARWGTGQGHWRLTSGGLWYRLRTGRLRVTGWRLWLSEVWMPCSYRCLLDWNEQIRVSHVQFKIPPVSGRGVTSGLPSRWNRHSAGHRVVPKPCHLIPPLPPCRAIKQWMQGMVFRYMWVFILKTIQWHIHAGLWSLVNCLAGSPYKALYKVLMNINYCWPRPWWWSVYPRDTPTNVSVPMDAMLKFDVNADTNVDVDAHCERTLIFLHGLIRQNFDRTENWTGNGTSLMPKCRWRYRYSWKLPHNTIQANLSWYRSQPRSNSCLNKPSTLQYFISQ